MAEPITITKEYIKGLHEKEASAYGYLFSFFSGILFSPFSQILFGKSDANQIGGIMSILASGISVFSISQLREKNRRATPEIVRLFSLTAGAVTSLATLATTGNISVAITSGLWTIGTTYFATKRQNDAYVLSSSKKSEDKIATTGTDGLVCASLKLPSGTPLKVAAPRPSPW